MPRLKPTKQCQYCQSEIDIHSLTRHETKCKDRSPEQRAEALHSRTKALARYHQEKREKERAAQPQPQEQAAPAPVGRTHRVQQCRYCHEAIGLGHIVRHEAECATRTPAQRLVRTSKRDYSRVLRNDGNGSTAPEEPKPVCRFCHEPIHFRHLERHETLCATHTAEQRKNATQARLDRGRFLERRAHLPTTNGRRAPARVVATNGKRISLTLSADFDVLRDLLVQLAPSLTLDKVEVL